MKILFQNARILTMKNDQISEGDLVVIDNRIAYIGNDSREYGPFDRVIDCHKNLLMPGLKNAHAHSAMVFLKGSADGVNLQDWLFKIVFPREAKLIPSDIYHLNKACYLEYFRNGITACFDHYFFPMEGAKAAEEMGMRTLLLATCDPGKTTVDDIEKNYRYFKSKKDGLVTYIDGFHAEYTANEELIEETRKAVNKLKIPFFTHISETEKEVKECIGRHGKTPLEYLYDQGLFAYGGGGFHCVYLTDREVEIVRDNNLYIISCPGSNTKLDSGIAPLTKYWNANLNIALGTDGPASNDSLDMFRELRLAALYQNKQIPDFEMLKMATVNAAHAMGLDNADVLDVGKYADIIMIDLSKPNMNNGIDLINNLVYSVTVDNVMLTMINGQILYENGRYNLKEKLADIYAKADEIAKRLEKDL